MAIRVGRVQHSALPAGPNLPAGLRPRPTELRVAYVAAVLRFASFWATIFAVDGNWEEAIDLNKYILEAFGSDESTRQIREVLQSRHRPESVYRVDNLTQLLTVAAKTANTLTTVLLLISVLTLIVSGVGIMNIMLATVNARTREIGVRKAVGATKGEIRAQFLMEAILISLSGGIVGIIVGLALPFSVRFITNYRVPVSGWSVIIAVAVSSLVGVLFGTAPATRAAKFDPIESLRYE